MKLHFQNGRFLMRNGRFLDCCCVVGDFRVWWGLNGDGWSPVAHLVMSYDPSTHTFVLAFPEWFENSDCYTDYRLNPQGWSYILVVTGSGPLMTWGVSRSIGGAATNILIGLLLDPLTAPKGTVWQLGSGNDYTVYCGGVYPNQGTPQNVSVYVEKMTSKTWTL